MVLKSTVKSGVPGEVFVAVQSAHSASPWFCCDFGPFLATVPARHRSILPYPWLLHWACFRFPFACVSPHQDQGEGLAMKTWWRRGNFWGQWGNGCLPLEHYPELQLGGRTAKAPPAVLPSAHGRNPNHPKPHSHASAHQKICEVKPYFQGASSFENLSSISVSIWGKERNKIASKCKFWQLPLSRPILAGNKLNLGLSPTFVRTFIGSF